MALLKMPCGCIVLTVDSLDTKAGDANKVRASARTDYYTVVDCRDGEVSLFKASDHQADGYAKDVLRAEYVAQADSDQLFRAMDSLMCDGRKFRELKSLLGDHR